MKKIIRGRRKWHNVEISNFSTLLNVINITKLWQTRWAEFVRTRTYCWRFNQSFITAFKMAHTFILNQKFSTRSHPVCWKSTLILSTYLFLRLSRALFSSGLFTKALYASFSSPVLSTCPAHLILFDLVTGIMYAKGYAK